MTKLLSGASERPKRVFLVIRRKQNKAKQNPVQKLILSFKIFIGIRGNSVRRVKGVDMTDIICKRPTLPYYAVNNQFTEKQILKLHVVQMKSYHH